MAFNFWEAQKKARSRTTLYVAIFLVLTAFVSWGVEEFIQAFAEPCEPGDPYCQTEDAALPFYGPLFGLFTIAIAAFQYWRYSVQGGAAVAESMGCKLVDPKTTNFKEQQLLNIVREMAIASGKPMPEVYLIPANEINAFAAGLTPEKAAVAVSVGAMNQLSREELQGVVAHEFGHIYNGDMKISLRLAAMVMAFSFILYLGLRILQFSSYRGRDDRNGNGQMIIAVAFTVGGALMWIFGSILKACVSREREYLADACAVQFTRSTDGIAGALRKIAKPQAQGDMPATGSSYSHLYIEDKSAFSSIFATHPPIEDRISAIEGMKYLPDEWKNLK